MEYESEAEILLLDSINSPADLKRLDEAQLEELAEEIRQFIIEKVSQNGGHLAPSLGVVELTLAIHRVFNSPVDRIVWDTGHQAYTHKIITGRRNGFERLRQYGGLSGFPRRAESVHDRFDTGHAGTGLSAAYGIAVARDLSGGHYHVVAIVGDGALTSGLTLEALNNIGESRRRLIVVLNDNEWSIAPNVGAVSVLLARMRTDRSYLRLKNEAKSVLEHFPVGKSLSRSAERLKDGVKQWIVPGMWFEELGFTYLGPINGHRTAELETVLSHAKELEGPVVIHVLTQKGKGYAPAEQDPNAFHSPAPFVIATGQPKQRAQRKSYSEVFAQTLIRLAQEDPRIVAITAAMPDGTQLNRFAEIFPNRTFDVGIAEAHATTMAAALAAEGKRPVFAVYSTFLQRAYDQIVHDVCRQNLPVLFAIDRAGLVGQDGDSHQGIFDIAYLRHIPNLTLMMPKDENELQHMLYTAFRLEGPVAIRYPRGVGEGVALDQELCALPIGHMQQTVACEKPQLAFVALGPMHRVAVEAATQLAKEGIGASVYNARFVKPMDQSTLTTLAKQGVPIVTVEEHVRMGGFGSAVLEALNDAAVPATVVRIGLDDAFVPQGQRGELLEHAGLTAERLIEVAQQLLARKKAERPQLRVISS